MEPYQITLAGLVLDIVGATLVAVDAVRLPNVRRAADWIRQLDHGLGGPDAVIRDGEFAGFAGSRRRWLGWLLVHAAGWAALSALLIVTTHQFIAIDVAFLLSPSWMLLVYWPMTLILLWLGSFALAEFAVHILVGRMLYGLEEVLSWVEANAPSGTVGVIGLSLLVAGFFGQLVGTWLGRP